MLRSNGTHSGFTLFELVMVIVIAGVLFTVGTISYKNAQVSNIKLSSRTDLLINDIRSAQNYAITNNVFVKVSIDKTSYSIIDAGYDGKKSSMISIAGRQSPFMLLVGTFDNVSEFTFNGRGRLTCSKDSKPINPTFSLNKGAKTITVNCNTGYVDVK